MGNVCAGPNNFGANGLFQSIASAFNKNPLPDGRFPPSSNAVNNSNNSTVNYAQPIPPQDLNAKIQVHITPPEVVKIIPRNEKSPPKPQSNNNINANANAKKDEKPSNHNVDAREVERPVKTEAIIANTNGGGGGGTNVTHARRPSSMGLQLESELGGKGKSGKIKDFYSLGRKLGEGQYGTTYFCLEKLTGSEYACKSILKRNLVLQVDVDDLIREIQVMHHVAGHPSMVKIVGAYEDAVTVYIVMELCKGGELLQRILQTGRYTEKNASEIAKKIVSIVEALHSMGVMHRDLKPENLLFAGPEEDSQLKVIDFGLSTFFKPGETFDQLLGSPYYVAPEVLLKSYGKECDVWSAGVMIYVLLSGFPPFWAESEEDIFKQVLHEELDLQSDPWPSISASAKDLLRKMLAKDPTKRLTAREVLNHSWFHTEGLALDRPLDSVVLTRLKQFSTSRNKLKKIAIRVIAESLSEDEIAGLKQMFKMIDTDNSGNITREELKTGLERVGAVLNDSEINRLMQSADTDNSGTIDYGEFLAAMLHETKVQQEDNLYAAFTYFDKDGSGYITLDELQQVCQQFGLQDVQLDDLIREVDQDNDGRIDYNEFAAMMRDSGLSNLELGTLEERV